MGKKETETKSDSNSDSLSLSEKKKENGKGERRGFLFFLRVSTFYFFTISFIYLSFGRSVVFKILKCFKNI